MATGDLSLFKQNPVDHVTNECKKIITKNKHDGHSYVTRSPIYILIENFKVLLPSLEGGGQTLINLCSNFAVI